MDNVIHLNNVEVDLKKEVCAICRKNPVSKWCDFTTRYVHNKIFFREYTAFRESNLYGQQNEQCDLPMCEDCAIEQNGDMDLCPHHAHVMTFAPLPDEYQRMRQQREKTSFAFDTAVTAAQSLDRMQMNDEAFYKEVQKIAKDNDALRLHVMILKKQMKEIEQQLESYEKGQMKLLIDGME